MIQGGRFSTFFDKYAITRGNISVKNFSKDIRYLHCICNNDDGIGLSCFKCGCIIHYCLEKESNRGKLFECASCISLALDPVFQVKKVLVDSYFKIENIFQHKNNITFEFFVSQPQSFYSIQVRALKVGSTWLTYPWQGIIEINDDYQHHYQLRPLKFNSNRKTRRQEFITFPPKKANVGKNYIRFKLPALDKQTFGNEFQCEETGKYYFSINLIQQFTNQQVVRQTFSQRRLQKKQSLALLTTSTGQFQITQNKLCLICPYTRERIKVPVRGKYCTHFSCVCLQTLIASHVQKRFWSCPICQKKINQPYVDIWIYDMLQDNQEGNDVIVQRDGTYQWVGNQNKNNTYEIDSSSSQEPVIQQPKEKPQQREIVLLNPNAERPQVPVETPIPPVATQSVQMEMQAPHELIEEAPVMVQERQDLLHRLLAETLKSKMIQAEAAMMAETQSPPEKTQERPLQIVAESKKTANQPKNTKAAKEFKELSRQLKEPARVTKERGPKIQKKLLQDIFELRCRQTSFDDFQTNYIGDRHEFYDSARRFMDRYPGLRHAFKEIAF